MPLTTQVLVGLGQTAIAGETVLADLRARSPAASSGSGGRNPASGVRRRLDPAMRYDRSLEVAVFLERQRRRILGLKLRGPE